MEASGGRILDGRLLGWSEGLGCGCGRLGVSGLEDLGLGGRWRLQDNQVRWFREGGVPVSRFLAARLGPGFEFCRFYDLV